MMSLVVSLIGLPEQVRFTMSLEEADDAHSVRADPDRSQTELILHTGLSEDSLPPTETAEPQLSTLQRSPVSFRVQRE